MGLGLSGNTHMKIGLNARAKTVVYVIAAILADGFVEPMER
tara:strand:+ start:1021 stop:1143 length:123 start_codon:yes stop_codon:yes gene_type:complete